MMIAEIPLKSFMKRQKCSRLFKHVINFLREKKPLKKPPGIKGFLNALGARETKNDDQKLKRR